MSRSRIGIPVTLLIGKLAIPDRSSSQGTEPQRRKVSRARFTDRTASAAGHAIIRTAEGVWFENYLERAHTAYSRHRSMGKR